MTADPKGWPDSGKRLGATFADERDALRAMAEEIKP
jgi:hypothetical protein